MADQEPTARLRIRLKGSEIGCTERQRQTIRGLGLRRIGDARELEKTPAVLGMIEKVAHLVEVEEENDAGRSS
ncbi:MAG TPA: 50S ribosomal protein L30 [Candidatus Binatia bacterium]|nr:50S ribosomal protein L30 [Candidatus Binatia bacterium]